MTWSNRKKKHILTRIQRTKDLKETNLTEFLVTDSKGGKQCHHLASVHVVVHPVRYGFFTLHSDIVTLVSYQQFLIAPAKLMKVPSRLYQWSSVYIIYWKYSGEELLDQNDGD